jgi:hypothetical protein
MRQITSDSVAFVTILVCHQLQYSALVHSIAVNIMFQPTICKEVVRSVFVQVADTYFM